MKYTKIFSTTADYDAFIKAGGIYPNISLLEDSAVVKFNPLYCIIFTAQEDTTTIKFTPATDGTTTLTPNLEISFDGEQWEKWDKETAGTFPEQVLAFAKEKLYVRGINTTMSVVDGTDPLVYHNSLFEVSTGKATIGGNPMGLLDYTKTSFELTTPYCFYGLFNSTAFGANLVNEEEWVDPATTVTYKSIVEFKLPATTLSNHCYDSMFAHTGIKYQPVLPAYTLAEGCYQGMYNACIALTKTNVKGEDAYLMSKEYAKSCYQSMYEGCVALDGAPVLRGEVLAESCFNSMFKGCTVLAAIECMATDITALYCTQNWVDGVAAAGTFTKSADMTKWTTGANGIPTGWTVISK